MLVIPSTALDCVNPGSLAGLAALRAQRGLGGITSGPAEPPDAH